MSWEEWMANAFEVDDEWVAIKVEDDRLRGACRAMARFMIFVWMEAVACRLAYVVGSFIIHDRAGALRNAIEDHELLYIGFVR